MRKWDDGIKIRIKEIVGESVNWIYAIRERAQRWLMQIR